MKATHLFGSLLFVMVLTMLNTGCANFGKRAECWFSSDRYYANGVVIREDYLDRNDYNLEHKYVGQMDKVEYITIHNTWNVAPAYRERAYLNNRQDGVYISFQYAVDETEAIEIMPPGERGWHAGDGRNGDGNAKSIGIEICRSRCVGDEEELYRQAEENAVHLAAYLLYKYQLGIERLRKHQDWSGKNCPHRILDENRWEEFKGRVKESLDELND